MDKTHSHLTTTPSTYSGSANAAADAAVVNTPRPREIRPEDIDQLAAELIKQANDNPASLLEPPPPASAEEMASASSALTSIDPMDQSMSIESLMLLMQELMLKTSMTQRDIARGLRNLAYTNVERLQFAAADKTRQTKGDVMNQAWTNFAFGVTESIAGGLAASKGEEKLGQKGVWSAVSGIVKSSGGVLTAKFKTDEIEHEAQGKELTALATTQERLARNTGDDGVQNANEQVKSVKDAMAKVEDERHRSIEKLAGG